MAPGISLTDTTSIASRLPVDADPGRKLGCFAQRFAQRWVRMDVGTELPGGGLQEAGQSCLRDQLRGVLPDDMDPKQIAGRPVVDDLGEAVRLVLDQRHGVVLEGKALRLWCVSRRFRLLLR